MDFVVSFAARGDSKLALACTTADSARPKTVRCKVLNSAAFVEAVESSEQWFTYVSRVMPVERNAWKDRSSVTCVPLLAKK